MLAYLLLITGLTISSVAIYYSVVGLAAIFAGAAIPVYIMGVTLEVAKLVGASWLKQYWKKAPGFIKTYMLIAISVLMMITSIGIFGYLSKAHLDQGITSSGVADRIATLDNNLAIQTDNLNIARTSLKQLDAAVDQLMSRTTDAQGVARSAALRKAQQKDRAALQAEVVAIQKEISAINSQKSPIIMELRKVEAEVGPLKYIAQLIYGSNPDANLLEKAVTWVIIMIVVVFDPLAIVMLLAAQLTFGWNKEQKLVDEQKVIADAKAAEIEAAQLAKQAAEEATLIWQEPTDIQQSLTVMPPLRTEQSQLDRWGAMIAEVETAIIEENAKPDSNTAEQLVVAEEVVAEEVVAEEEVAEEEVVAEEVVAEEVVAEEVVAEEVVAINTVAPITETEAVRQPDELAVIEDATDSKKKMYIARDQEGKLQLKARE